MRTPRPAIARLRCAIYTRKSSEEGLEQSFNSLDAQREACEAYIMSQVGEGWSALPARYDDGGFSGGSMERPGLKQLLADIALRTIDVVVVYKVDRLTRSLTDFARIVEIFDGHGVSFVSVTQAFNTTTSMGRLTLNVLLSFAQFEREVTGERIRDKIAASKKKGMWMGGTPPLGYRAHERTLVIDEAEAATVRHVFERYLVLGSVYVLKDELESAGFRSRPSKRTGTEGAALTRGALYHLLSNRLYVGEIVHKDASYPGLHPAIIDRSVFDRVSELLEANRHETRHWPLAVGRSALTGLVFDADGQPLCPVATRNRHGRIYRYYVSALLQRGGRRADKTLLRVPAQSLEELVLDRLQRVSPVIQEWKTARSQLERVEVEPRSVRIICQTPSRPRLDSLDVQDTAVRLGDRRLEITCSVELRPWGGRIEIVRPDNHRAAAKARVDASLLRGLVRAHALVRTARSAPAQTMQQIGVNFGATESYVRRLSRLAFLAPDIQHSIINGEQPAGVTLERLMRTSLPLGWGEQRALLGFSPR